MRVYEPLLILNVLLTLPNFLIMKPRFKLLLLFVGMLGVTPLAAQDASKTFDAHFDDIINKSNRYEDYKVVKRYKLDNLKKAITDTVVAYKEDISALENNLATNNAQIDALKADLAKIQADLKTAVDAENNMSVFGIQTSKGAYNGIMWSSLGILLLLLLVFIFRFKNSNAVTKDAQAKLVEVEEEFESHRQRSLEREQQIRRKLQDELNKNKKAQA